MCSFTFIRSLSPIDDASLARSNRFSQRRGPDLTHYEMAVLGDGRCLTLLHNLLDISGTTCRQPRVAGAEGDRTFLLFNGEIYNYREFSDASSDTEAILAAFPAVGADLGRRLEGEFSIVAFVERENSLHIFTDPFLTKPLYLGRDLRDGRFGVATCASSLRELDLPEISLAEPNARYRIQFDGDDARIEIQHPVIEFDLRQHKSNFDDWTDAFMKAVRLRATHGAHQPAVFLSSGYDSAGICVALNAQGLPYDTFSMMGGEVKGLLRKRFRINRAASCGDAHEYPAVEKALEAELMRDILEEVEPFEYFHEDAPGVVTSLQRDTGAIGANFIARESRRHGRLVILSGSGADEIMSDYGFAGRKHYYHSEFGGLFPDSLEGFFPWRKFYGDTQRSYLFKDEFILGRHGLEGRFPYLDRRVVQEFLWLTSELKNRWYKAPLEHLFSTYGYPFERGVKRGFNPLANRRGVLQRIGRRLRGMAVSVLGR